MNIGFRAEGGPNIGMGHIMRCLSLAKEFRRAGSDVCFFSSIVQGIDKILSKDFKVVRLPKKENTSSAGLCYEIPSIIRQLRQYNIDILVVDTYMVDKEYLDALRPYVKLVYIDDLNTFIYPVHVLVNGNITAEYEQYIKYDDKELMLLGPRYNLIRDEFRNVPARIVRNEVQEIMLTTGGTDPYHLTEMISQWILEDGYFSNIKLHVVIGGGFGNTDVLEQLSAQYPNLMLYYSIKYMSEIMLNSDIAISAGGSTLYELCTCGTPSFAFIMADNQEKVVQQFSMLGFIECLGWYHTMDRSVFLTSLKNLCRDHSRRQRMANEIQRLVDAYGTQRVVQAVLDFYIT